MMTDFEHAKAVRNCFIDFLVKIEAARISIISATAEFDETAKAAEAAGLKVNFGNYQLYSLNQIADELAQLKEVPGLVKIYRVVEL